LLLGWRFRRAKTPAKFHLRLHGLAGVGHEQLTGLFTPTHSIQRLGAPDGMANSANICQHRQLNNTIPQTDHRHLPIPLPSLLPWRLCQSNKHAASFIAIVVRWLQ
jgi:hypothetical protein